MPPSYLLLIVLTLALAAPTPDQIPEANSVGCNRNAQSKSGLSGALQANLDTLRENYKTLQARFDALNDAVITTMRQLRDHHNDDTSGGDTASALGHTGPQSIRPSAPTADALGCASWQQVADTSVSLIRYGNADIPTSIQPSPLGLYRFSNHQGTKRLYIKDLSANFVDELDEQHSWRSDNPSDVECAVNDDTSWTLANPAGLTDRPYPTPRTVASQVGGSPNGWMLWSDGSSLQARGFTHPCPVPGSSEGEGDLFLLEVCQA